VGAAVLAKALVGVFLIFLSTGAGVAIAGYLMIEPPAAPGPVPTPIPGLGDDGGNTAQKVIAPVEPGGPRTLLVLGSDRRAKNSRDSRMGQEPHSDTIVLVRLDPKRHRIAVLSLPRDLSVTIPGDADGVKINQAYDDGGAALTAKTVKYLFAPAAGGDFKINGVIDVNFRGFQEAVSYVKGVYIDVDRKYYNPEGTGYAAIDVKAGYQRLAGSDALAYVRYRHGDSDLYRNARQQDFLRQATAQRSVRELTSINDAKKLFGILQQYFSFDKNFKSRRNLAGLLKTAVNFAMNHTVVNQIKFRGIAESDDPTVDTRLFISPENLDKIYNDFMTGAHSKNPPRSDVVVTEKKSEARAASRLTGLVSGRRAGEDMAVLAAKKLDMPFYFPRLITNRTQYVTGTPRIYKIKDEDGKRHNAYRIVAYAGETGEYWGVQGLTWRDPPILADPDRLRKLRNGRTLMLYYDGAKIVRVAWKTPRGVYWVSNSIGRKISNARMVAIAASLTRLHS